MEWLEGLMPDDITDSNRNRIRQTRLPGELHVTLRQGRWLLAGAQTLLSLFVLARGQASGLLWVTLAGLAVYNVLTIVAVRRLVMPRFLVPIMLALDLLFVLLAARLTGGAQSPFLAQSYLIILAAALLYELWGGITVAIAACLIVFGAQYPFWLRSNLPIPLLGTLLPSYILAGGFTGFLVRRLKTYYERDVAARLRSQAADQEMRLAHEMQKASLPALPPVVQGLDSAFLTRFAGEVGGDFLLFVAPEAESKTEPLLGITIGDITGKGIPAALGAIGIAHLLPWLRPLDDPCRALHDLNVDLCERLPEAYFATLSFVEVRRETVRLWTAGHPPALLWNAKEKRVIALADSVDPPLGLFPNWQGEPVEIAWDIGDVLLLYTDGANETRNARGEQFTVDGIIKSLSRCGGASAAEIVQTLRQDVEAWGTPVDDMTLVVCRRVPDAWKGNVGSRTNDDAM
jgi:hypothetical protein